MCYKPYMRKWMRERLKRRKKTDGPSPEKTTAPMPLQPKYFDSEPAEAEPAAAAAKPLPRSEPEPESESAAAQPKQRPSRRRRGRGGRGRAARPQQAESATAASEAQPPAPEAVGARPAVAVPVSAPAESTPEPARASKGTVVLAIGLPGSGKSSWFKRHNIRPLSSDLLRQLLFDDAEEQRFQDLVFSNLRSMLKARLIARRPMSYVDATNLTPHDRSSWIKLARDYGYDVQGVFFDVPLEVCLERNHKRNRTVGDDVMRRMSAKLKAPTFEEGFSKLTVVRVKKQNPEGPMVDS